MENPKWPTEARPAMRARMTFHIVIVACLASHSVTCISAVPGQSRHFWSGYTALPVLIMSLSLAVLHRLATDHGEMILSFAGGRWVRPRERH
jgi:hypothetical protein